MKKVLAVLSALSLLVHGAIGQSDLVRPRAIGVSFFLDDFATASNIRSSSLSHVIGTHSWAKLKDMNSGIAINYFQGMSKHVDFAASFGGCYLIYPMKDKTFINDNLLLEATASVNLKMTTEAYWVQPYLIAGIGAHTYKKYYGAFMPLGVGLKVNLFDEAHIFITSQYRVAVTPETASYHFQHSMGIAGVLGKKKPKVIPPPPDTDGDGVPDAVDKCPTVPGPAKYQGCPVPDTDKDGINDDDDKCPTVAGLARYQGCPVPDTDKDGINDDDDKCPTESGVARYQGCPVPDTDKDGVNDEDDKCPTVAGSPDNDGCPVIPDEIKKTVDYAAQNILFVTNSYILVKSSFKGLDEVAALMEAHPDMVLQIDGHTDNVGSDEFNQKLSEHRAEAVKRYFVKKGVDESRIATIGHGESAPVAENTSAAGRKLNRRVEMKLSYKQ